MSVARRRLRRGATILAGSLLLALLTWDPLLRALPRLLVAREAPCAADAIVVLAGDHHAGRVDHAATLFAQGYLPRGPFLVSGGPLYGDLAWAEVMAARAQARGVPAERIVRQATSTTTVEDAERSLALLAERDPPVKTVLLVTSAWHSARAARIFRDRAPTGMRIVSCPAADPPAEWWRDADLTRSLATEVLKRVWPGPGG